jgi:hypothetical protein
VKAPEIAPDGRQGLLKDRAGSTPARLKAAFGGKWQKYGPKAHQTLTIFNPLAFPHSLQEFCSGDFGAKTGEF